MFCRLCVSESSDFIDIFETENSEVYSIISKCFSFVILKDDAKSNVVCQSCLEVLNNFYSFCFDIEKAQEKWDLIVCIKKENDQDENIQKEEINENSDATLENNFIKEETINEEQELQTIKCPVNFTEEGYIKNDSSDCDSDLPFEYDGEQSMSLNEDEEPINFSCSSDEEDDNQCPSSNEEDDILNILSISDVKEESDASYDSESMCLENDNENNNLSSISTKKKKNQDDLLKQESVINNHINNLLNKLKKSPTTKIYKNEALQNLKIVFSCHLCYIKFKSFFELRLHCKIVHKTRGLVKCCKRKFYNDVDLAKHTKNHKNPENPIQNHCKATFKTEDKLENHQTSNGKSGDRLPCFVCGKTFINTAKIKYHIRTYHKDDLKRMCQICGLASDKETFETHYCTAHEAVKIKKKHKYKCNICNEELCTIADLKMHKIELHNDSTYPDVILKCKICGKSFLDGKQLRCHLTCVHKSKLVHDCMHCEKSFQKAHQLRDHINTHTGDRPHKCPYCPKTFKSSPNLAHHRKHSHPLEFEATRRARTKLKKKKYNE